MKNETQKAYELKQKILGYLLEDKVLMTRRMLCELTAAPVRKVQKQINKLYEEEEIIKLKDNKKEYYGHQIWIE